MGHGVRAKAVDPRTDVLQGLQQKAEDVFEEVQAKGLRREAALDARLQSDLADCVEERARRDFEPERVDPEAFLASVRYRYSSATALAGLDVDWDRFGTFAGGYTRPVTLTGHMLGPMDVVLRAPMARQARQKPVLGPEKHARQAGREDFEEDVENERTHGIMTLVKEQLSAVEQSGAASMFELINNPGSFAQTVENAYALAHNAKNGKVEVGRDDGGTAATVRYRANGKPGGERTQFVVRLTMADWQAMNAGPSRGGRCLIADRPAFEFNTGAARIGGLEGGEGARPVGMPDDGDGELTPGLPVTPVQEPLAPPAQPQTQPTPPEEGAGAAEPVQQQARPRDEGSSGQEEPRQKRRRTTSTPASSQAQTLPLSAPADSEAASSASPPPLRRDPRKGKAPVDATQTNITSFFRVRAASGQQVADKAPDRATPATPVVDLVNDDDDDMVDLS